MASHATPPTDPLQLLSHALSVAQGSDEQRTLLATLREQLEAQPGPIPILCTTLIATVSGAGDSLLKRWVLDLLHFAISRSSLSLDTRAQLATQCLDVLAALLQDPAPVTVKAVVQCFSSVYPLLFRVLCASRTNRQQWETVSRAKSQILDFVTSTKVTLGVKEAALKFLQRVIQVQTRGVSDPRLQNKADPNLTFCPADHPFISSTALDTEGTQLLETVVTVFFTSPYADILTSLLNSWGTLIKHRPLLNNIFVSALAAWTPAALAAQSTTQIKSVEKAVRILLIYIMRSSSGVPFHAQIAEALTKQEARMKQALSDEQSRKLGEAAAIAEATRKRNLPPSPEDLESNKRPKLEHAGHSPASGLLADFDFSVLPSALLTEIVITSLQAISEEALNVAVGAHRAKSTGAATVAASSALAPVSADAPVVVKEEPVDPLKMDIDDDEIAYEPAKLSMELADVDALLRDGAAERARLANDEDAILRLGQYVAPRPRLHSPGTRKALIASLVSKIHSDVKPIESSEDTAAAAADTEDDAAKPVNGLPAKDMWMLMLVRMITRARGPEIVAEEADAKHDEERDEIDTNATKYDDSAHGHSNGSGLALVKTTTSVARADSLRQTVCGYVLEDFSARVRLATVWMNEEWFNDLLQAERDPHVRRNYDIWLRRIVDAYQDKLDPKERTFPRFLLDLPFLPQEVLSFLQNLCFDPERMQVGFTTLRELVALRIPSREAALGVLLDLTTHPEKVTRNASIITVKRWVPDVKPMGGIIMAFALQMLRRLQKSNSSAKKEPGLEGDSMEDGQLTQEELPVPLYLPASIPLPAEKAVVLQHIELLFALSVKVPDFLDEIFVSYGHMDVSVQAAIQELITALVRSLGPNNGKLLTLLRTFPPGAETLALRILTIFTENARPTAPLVAVVKGLVSERDLDARFLIPIIADMDKADIIRHLPRIVSTLNGKPEEKSLVRSVFVAIVTTHQQTYGSATSNQPRVRQSDLLTPSELMVLLHESEKEIGLKATIEAVGICFSMTEVFSQEVLAVVMQQIVDEPVLPVLFLRTVIQAVTTYKSLVGFVSTTLLSRLITKKIWQNAPLWEGFIRCAKVIAPASFGALLQLPKDQLREIVDKQPGLKAGLREYVIKKAGNKARVAAYLEVFGEDGSESPTAPPQALPTAVETQ